MTVEQKTFDAKRHPAGTRGRNAIHPIRRGTGLLSHAVRRWSSAVHHGPDPWLEGRPQADGRPTSGREDARTSTSVTTRLFRGYAAACAQTCWNSMISWVGPFPILWTLGRRLPLIAAEGSHSDRAAQSCRGTCVPTRRSGRTAGSPPRRSGSSTTARARTGTSLVGATWSWAGR